ncbi:zinc ribbon domain-containing protein [Candidatus Pacearchaeota archaeon]|nr:zinc ribbon domain-containing protein [Candidatus Pacearchaeota archaeon]
MFEKKCKSCGEKLTKEFRFCPFCGASVKNNSDYGMLGTTDDIEELAMGIPNNFNKMFSGLMEEIENDFKEFDKQERKTKNPSPDMLPQGIRINICSGDGKKFDIKIGGLGNIGNMNQKAREIKIPFGKLTDEDAKRLSSLPREEAKTGVKRIGNSVVYELNLPGITNIKEIIMNKLENSLEIKAFSKDRVYFKIIPIKQNLYNYKFEKEKLFLEFKA